MSEALYAVRVSNDKHDECNVALGSSPGYAPAVGGGQYTEAPNVWLQIRVAKFRTGRNDKLLKRDDLTPSQRMSLSSEDRSERYKIVIGPEAFADLAAHMMKAEPGAAIKAFGAALQAVPEIPKVQPDKAA
jgi:hypothetical protein